MSTPADSSPYRDSSTRRFVANSLTRRSFRNEPSFFLIQIIQRVGGYLILVDRDQLTIDEILLERGEEN